MRFREIVIALTLLSATDALAEGNKPFLDQAISSPQDAISVARVLQIARTRGQPNSPIREEAFWQANFTAALSNGIWEVRSKARYAPDIAAVTVRIRQDGQFRGLFYCRQADCSAPRVQN